MDAVVILVLTLIAMLRVTSCNSSIVVNETNSIEVGNAHETQRVVKTNDTYYKDENAFCSIINALGFPKEIQ